MAGAQRRTPRFINRNPLLLMQAKQKIGLENADTLIYPFAAHLYEATQGRAYGLTIRQLTVYISAAHDAALYYGRRDLSALVNKARDSWILANHTSRDHGITDRVVLTSEAMAALKALFCKLLELLPGMEQLVWHSCMMDAAERWQRFAKDSVFRHATM